MTLIRVTILAIGLALSIQSQAHILPESLTDGVSESDIEYICSFAPSQSVAAGQLKALATGGALGAELILLANNLKYVNHSSGYLILTKSGRYLKDTIGTRPLTSSASIVVPAAMIVAGTAVAFELVCVNTNYPEQVAKLKDNGQDYLADANSLLENASIKAKDISSSKLDGLTEAFKKYKTITRDKVYELLGETWYQRAVRKTKEAFKGD